jgi:UDP-glucose 4-epimerase
MAKALITGGAGFIGGFLAEHLLDLGWRVDILDNFARGRSDRFLKDLLARDGARLIECDLLAGEDAVATLDQDYSHLFHFAAILGVQNVIDNPGRTLSANVRLLETALALGRRQAALDRFVFASTSEVYAGSLETVGLAIPTPEDHVIALPDLARPRTSYMLSKLYGESMVRLSGLPYTILRPHNVYGPRMGQSHVVPQLLRKAFDAPDGGAIEVFSVDHTRTFCFIDDAVEMARRAAMSEICRDEVLNVGAQAPEHRIEELAHIVIETVGKDLTIAPGPETQGSPSRRAPDMTRMFERTGYAAAVGLAEGVRRAYDWYRANVFDRDRMETAV